MSGMRQHNAGFCQHCKMFLSARDGTGGTKHGNTHLEDIHCLLSVLVKPWLLVIQYRRIDVNPEDIVLITLSLL